MPWNNKQLLLGLLVDSKLLLPGLLVDSADYQPEEELFPEGKARGKKFLRGVIINSYNNADYYTSLEDRKLTVG